MSSVLRLVRMVSFAVLVAVTATLAVSVVVLAWMVLTPTYYASVDVRADSEGEARAVMDVISTRPVAEETIRRVGVEMSPEELLNDLSVNKIPHGPFVHLTQEGDEPGTPTQIALTLFRVSSERIWGEAESGDANLKTQMAHPAKAPVVGATPAPLRPPLLPILTVAACLGALIVLLVPSSADESSARRTQRNTT